jgi:hypothetical protein
VRGHPLPVKIWGWHVGFGRLKSFGEQLQGADGDIRLFILLLGRRTSVVSSRKNESDKKTKEERKKQVGAHLCCGERDFNNALSFLLAVVAARQARQRRTAQGAGNASICGPRHFSLRPHVYRVRVRVRVCAVERVRARARAGIESVDQHAYLISSPS